MKLLLYCTKAKPYLYKPSSSRFLYTTTTENLEHKLNGKIVGECDFEVEEIFYQDGTLEQAELGILGLRTKSLCEEDLLFKSCLSYKQLNEYLRDTSPNGYTIHIKNLHIFDEPRELSDYSFINKFNAYQSVEKAPQNMMYVKQEKYYENNELKTIKDINKIIISIRPQWLCKILNGKKTIEVRKKVLKEMM